MVAATSAGPVASTGALARQRIGVSARGFVLAGAFGPSEASMITHALTLPAGNRPALVTVDLRRGGVVVVPHLHRDETRLALTGELDLATASMFAWALSFVLYRHPRRVALDLRRLGAIDARGAHAVGTAATRMGDWGGRLVVRRPRAAVRRVLELCDLGELIAETRDAAPLLLAHTHPPLEAGG